MSGLHMKAVYRRSIASATEDVMVTSHDLYKPGDGSNWSDAEMATAADKIKNFWSAIRDQYGSEIILQEIRCYNGYDGDGTPGEVDKIVTVNLAGQGSNLNIPQAAVVVTEETDHRKHWGRFYQPGPNVATITATGRITTAFCTTLANAAETMYEAWHAMGSDVFPVVWGLVKPNIELAVVAPPRWAPSWLLPTGNVGSVVTGAWAVQAIHVDDNWDIQRRRKYQTPGTKQRRQLG